MENMSPPRDPDAARSALSAASRTRERLTAGLRLPSELYPALSAAVAVQLATAAWGIAEQSVAGIAVLLAGLAAFASVAGLALHRFRRLNGARVDGLASQIVLGAGGTSSLTYLGALAAATWGAFDSRWWLVAVASVAGGMGYALGVHHWWRAYRSDPVAHASGASPRILAALALLAGLGFVALLVVG